MLIKDQHKHALVATLSECDGLVVGRCVPSEKARYWGLLPWLRASLRVISWP